MLRGFKRGTIEEILQKRPDLNGLITVTALIAIITGILHIKVRFIEEGEELPSQLSRSWRQNWKHNLQASLATLVVKPVMANSLDSVEIWGKSAG